MDKKIRLPETIKVKDTAEYHVESDVVLGEGTFG
jgi:hypothetical protein